MCVITVSVVLFSHSVWSTAVDPFCVCYAVVTFTHVSGLIMVGSLPQGKHAGGSGRNIVNTGMVSAFDIPPRT